MNFKTYLCIMAAVLFLCNASFAVSGAESKDNNPYGFEMVEEASDTHILEAPEESEDVDMEEVNKNDTYQAQTNADAAEIKRLERSAARINRKVKPPETVKSAINEKPAAAAKKPGSNKASDSFRNFITKPKVVKFIEAARQSWEKTKKRLVTLPGIRHWLASPYSMKNYKKETEAAGKENSAYLKKDSAGVKMVKEGGKKFFK